MAVRAGSLALVVAALGAPAPARAQPAATPLVLTLDGAFDQAARHHPTIEAARRRQMAAAQAVAVARERPNPELHVELTRETPTQAFTLAVPIETGGKRRQRIAVGDAGVAVSGAESARTLIDLHVAVRRAYFELAAARARLALLQEVHQIATRARDAARQRFDAGDVPRLEVLQADLTRAEAENQATAASGIAAAAAAQLRALLVLAPDAELSLATPVDAAIDRDLPAGISGVPPGHAELSLLDAQLEEQRARVGLATAMRVPDVTPEAALTRGAEPEFATGWRAGLAVALPIFTRHQAAVRLADAALSALTAERDAALARIRGEVAAATAVAAALSQQYRRYQATIVPQALEVEQLADDAYRLGRTGITAYLDALRASRDVRLRMLQAAADFQAARADLERALGTPLP